MSDWFKRRTSEPSSWMGLAAFAGGLMTFLKAKGAQEVAGTLQGVGEAVAVGIDPNTALITGAATGLAGILAAIFR